VTATINTQNFNPKHTITYAGRQAAKNLGHKHHGNVDTTGLTPGSLHVKEPQRMRRKRRTTSPAAKPLHGESSRIRLWPIALPVRTQ